MTEAFELEIVKQNESKKISVLWVEVESPTGNFVVGPNHSPLVSLLKYRGILKYQEYNGPEASIDTYGGILKVEENRTIVLI